MVEAPLDAERILQSLAEHSVEYVLIGGLAAQTHGHVRATSDADVIAAPDRDNLSRLAKALRSLDARVLNHGHEDAVINVRTLRRATTWRFTTRDGVIDVMYAAPGGAPFSELTARALRVNLGSIEVPVMDVDDLIRMKLARGRPADLADVVGLIDSENA